MHKTFDKNSFQKACKMLAKKHASIKIITDTFGYPPMYERAFGFETLVQIILEQQVSLASGRAVYNRLQQALGNITPHGLLQLTVDELRAVSVSRQKAGYLHHLSQMVKSNKLNLEEIPLHTDETVRQKLMQVKGIGPWTADVVLMLCLKRSDVFPIGDVALVNSVRHIHNRPGWTIEEIKSYAENYAPFRTIATYCYWHAYIQRKNISF
jgi:DNA-3-methyladenine glycosylase II